MLGKLLKHEFVATGRIMLPALAAVTGITLLANLMLRFGDALAEKLRLLSVLFVLVAIAAVIAVIAVEILTIVLMVLRFYRHLLGPEGYLTHALPVNVHQLVWSKIIVSSAWIVITNVLLVLLGMLTLSFAGRMNIGEILRGFPTWKDIMELMTYIGVSEARAKVFVAEIVVMILASLLVNCLHFYAAMSLGHIFSKNKLALSVLFYVGINVVFSVIGTIGMFGVQAMLAVGDMATGGENLVAMMRIFDFALVLQLIEAALLYVATVLGLKKGLNLA
jgi:hypothetical protein